MMRTLLTVLVGAVALQAQTEDLRITAQTLSKPTAKALFGSLPKGITAAAVQVCNQRADAVTVPESRIVQQVKLSQGVTILPPAAAIAVVAGKQGSSPWQTFARYGTAGLNVVSDLTALKVINPSMAVGAVIVSAATILGIGIRDIGPATASHQYAVLASAMLPDPLQLPALGCTATAYTLVESDPGAKTFDFGITLPQPAATK